MKDKEVPLIDSKKLENFSYLQMEKVDITKVDDEYLKNAYLKVWQQSLGNFKDAAGSILVAETTRRLLSRSYDILDTTNKEQAKTGRLSISISVLALVISLVTGVVAYFDFRSGNEWQQEEIRLLKEQLDLMKVQSKTQTPKK